MSLAPPIIASGIIVLSGLVILNLTRSPDGAKVGMLIAVIGVLLMLTLAAAAAFARDLDGRFANSPLKPWFDHLASGKGLCCSMADGATVDDPDWEVAGGHYRVRVFGNWVDVDDDAVITEPNRAGKTMVWPVLGPNGSVWVRCFMPGAEG